MPVETRQVELGFYPHWGSVDFPPILGQQVNQELINPRIVFSTPSGFRILGDPPEVYLARPTQGVVSLPEVSPLTPGQSRLVKICQNLSSDPDMQTFFSMTDKEMSLYLARVDLSKDGFHLSPSFQSPGWGISMRDPRISLSDFFNSDNTLRHEMKHALHYFLCKRLFESEERVDNFVLFKENVMADSAFNNWLSKNGSGIMLSVAAEIDDWNLGREEPIKRFSWALGALTYQHAYFVDPGMCEAVASFKDEGIVHILNEFNHLVGILFIPGDSAVKGYEDEHMQSLFKSATLSQKALLVPRVTYKRDNFFAQTLFLVR